VQQQIVAPAAEEPRVAVRLEKLAE